MCVRASEREQERERELHDSYLDGCLNWHVCLHDSYRQPLGFARMGNILLVGKSFSVLIIKSRIFVLNPALRKLRKTMSSGASNSIQTS